MDFTLAIAGSGSLAAGLERLARELGVADSVFFLGRVPDDDLPALYAAADLFVLPTVAYEGFGMATIEALASGTPVVGTPVGATPELLRGLDPRLVASGSGPEELADAIGGALARVDPALRDALRGIRAATIRLARRRAGLGGGAPGSRRGGRVKPSRTPRPDSTSGSERRPTIDVASGTGTAAAAPVLRAREEDRREAEGEGNRDRPRNRGVRRDAGRGGRAGAGAAGVDPLHFRRSRLVHRDDCGHVRLRTLDLDRAAGPFRGETVCDTNTTTGPVAYDDLRCENGVEIGVPLYEWSLTTTLYHGNQTWGTRTDNPILGPVYDGVKPHARAVSSTLAAADGGPAYDLEGPTGNSCS